MPFQADTELFNEAAETGLYDVRPARTRAADLLPIPEGGLILDAAPGNGNLAFGLAKVHTVVAVTPDVRQARFLEKQKSRYRIKSLSVVHGELSDVPFPQGAFQAAVLAPVPKEAGAELQAVLRHLKTLLAPGGLLFLGADNRYGLKRWRRPGSGPGQASGPCGYFGYRKAFRRAGFELVSTWLALSGADDPSILVAMNRGAIKHALHRNFGEVFRYSPKLRAALEDAISAPWLWRLVGNEFGFLLRAKDA